MQIQLFLLADKRKLSHELFLYVTCTGPHIMYLQAYIQYENIFREGPDLIFIVINDACKYDIELTNLSYMKHDSNHQVKTHRCKQCSNNSWYYY